MAHGPHLSGPLGRQTSEGLAEKYFVQLRDLRSRFGDVMGNEAQILDAFDETAQIFSSVMKGEEVAALISLEELEKRARNAYRLLKCWWESVLEEREA